MTTRPKKRRSSHLWWLAALILPSCVVDPAYVAFVRADRQRFLAIGQQWQAYVHADPTKSQAQRDDAVLLIDAWRQDLEAQEARVTR